MADLYLRTEIGADIYQEKVVMVGNGVFVTEKAVHPDGSIYRRVIWTSKWRAQ